MKYQLISALAIVAALALAAGCAGETEKTPEKKPALSGQNGMHEGHEGGESETAVKAQEACPVMGGKINKTVFADYKGMRIYFCCPGCIDEFNADPEKYLAKMKEAGVAPEKTP